MDRGPVEVGPSGFRNIEPLSRERRQAARDKETLEKARILSRRRGILDPPPNEFGNPVVPPRNTPAYIDEYDRFNRDVAGSMYDRKQQKLQQKEQLYSVKRAENYNRDRNIWASDNAAEQRQAARYETARNTGTGARRNQPGESFNIITLDYATNGGGRDLSSKDSATKERRQERAVVLYAKSHSVSHNILTGEPLKFPTPLKPQQH